MQATVKSTRCSSASFLRMDIEGFAGSGKSQHVVATVPFGLVAENHLCFLLLSLSALLKADADWHKPGLGRGFSLMSADFSIMSLENKSELQQHHFFATVRDTSFAC